MSVMCDEMLASLKNKLLKKTRNRMLKAEQESLRLQNDRQEVTTHPGMEINCNHRESHRRIKLINRRADETMVDDIRTGGGVKSCEGNRGMPIVGPDNCRVDCSGGNCK